MMTDTAAERRFLLLKKRLDALHYCQPLTIESSALVEKLLNDLVKTTEGFQQQKKQLEETKLQGTKNEHMLAPLKKEIMRLTQENNQLHMSMIQVKEDCEFKDNKWRAQVRMLENERNDWKFLMTQRTTQEKKLQDEILRLKSRGSENKDPNSTDEQRRLFERLNEAQQHLLEYKDQMRQTEQNGILTEEKLRHLETQVSNRDQEINRMKQRLESTLSNTLILVGSTNMDKLAMEYQLSEQLQKCQRLTTQVDLITQENSRLNEELETAKSKLAKHPIPRKAEEKTIPQDNNSKQLQQQLEAKESLVESLSSKLEDSKFEAQQLKGQVESLMMQNEELAQKAAKAEHVVQAYQSDKQAFNRVVDKMKMQQDETEGSTENLKNQIRELNAIIQQKGEHCIHLEAVQQSNLREKEILAKQVQRNKEELEKETEMCNRLREQIRRLEQRETNPQLNSLELKNQELLQENHELKLDRSESLQQIKLLQDALQRLKYENGSIAEKIDEFSRFEQERKQLNAQLRALEKKNQSLSEENHQTKLDLIEREQKVRVLQDSLSKGKYENEKLTEKINELADHTQAIQANVRRAHERDGEFTIMANELERLREGERRLIVEKEKLLAEAAKSQVFLANCSKNVEQLTRTKEELMGEVRELRTELSKNKMQDHDTKSVSIKLNERLNSQQTAMEDMRELLLREQKRTTKLNNDLNDQRQLYLSTQAQLEEALAQVKQLKSLSESLERSREELLTRLQSKNSEKLDEERLLHAARQEQLKVEEKLKHTESELLMTRKALEQIDQERDEMQFHLDEKTEENIQLQANIAKLNDELSRQQSKFVELQSRGDRGFETISTLEEKLRDGQFKSQRMQAEAENLRYTLSVKEKTLGELTTDLQIVSRENQNLTQQIAAFVQQKELLQQQHGYAQQQELRAREQLRLAEMEMRDLQTNYADVCADNQRLQSSMQQLSYQHQELMGRLGDLEKEDDFMGQQMMSAQRKEETLQNQIAHLERELQQVGRRCEEQERIIRESQRHQEQLLREYNSQRRVSAGFQSTQEDLQRQLANLDHERKICQDSVTAIKRELDIKESQFELERKRANDLEIVLIREREQMMRQNEEVQGLRHQNEALLNEIEKQNLRLMSTLPQTIMLGRQQDFGGLSRVSGDAPYVEQQELAHEISQLRLENQRLKLDNMRRSTQNDQQFSASREEQSSTIILLIRNSRLEQSAAWERLRQESEVFKKSINQTAMSSNYLKMKMKNLQKEYEQVLPPKYM